VAAEARDSAKVDEDEAKQQRSWPLDMVLWGVGLALGGAIICAVLVTLVLSGANVPSEIARLVTTVWIGLAVIGAVVLASARIIRDCRRPSRLELRRELQALNQGDEAAVAEHLDRATRRLVDAADELRHMVKMEREERALLAERIQAMDERIEGLTNTLARVLVEGWVTNHPGKVLHLSPRS